MITRRNLLTTAAAFAATPYILSKTTAFAATPKNIVVMAKAIDDVVKGFDPAEAYEFTNWEICANLYRTLVTVDPNDPGKIIGDLAESWEMAPDGINYTFAIRQGLKFESGNPITADDIAFSLHRVMKLGKGPSFTMSPLGWTGDNVEKMVRTDGDYTLLLTLSEKKASSILLSILTCLCGMVVDKKVAMANEVGGDFGNAWLNTHSASSGAYRLVVWQASDNIILEANPNAEHQPKIGRLVFRHVSDPATQLLLLKKGDVDIARNLGSDQLKSIEGDPDLTMNSANTLLTLFLTMNYNVVELQKKEVRQAIRWAIDYDAIANNITPKTYFVWQTFQPRGIPGGIERNPFRKDIEKAKALLIEAGYPNGFKITLDHQASSPFSDIAQAIQADLNDIGVTLELIASDAGQVATKNRAGNYQLVFGRWSPEYYDPSYNADAFCPSLSKDAGMLSRRANFTDQKIAEDVLAAAHETDPKKRLELYATIESEFQDISPFAFLLQQSEVAVQQKNISGLVIGSLGNLTRYDGITKG